MRPSPPPEPENAEEFNDRGNRYSRNGVYDQAIEDYSRAIGLDPGFAEAYFNRGVSKYELGFYDASIEDLTQAALGKPKAGPRLAALAKEDLSLVALSSSFFLKPTVRRRSSFKST